MQKTDTHCTHMHRHTGAPGRAGTRTRRWQEGGGKHAMMSVKPGKLWGLTVLNHSVRRGDVARALWAGAPEADTMGRTSG